MKVLATHSHANPMDNITPFDPYACSSRKKRLRIFSTYYTDNIAMALLIYIGDVLINLFTLHCWHGTCLQISYISTHEHAK